MPATPILPIDSHIKKIITSLENNHSIVIQAEPGAGKTTRVPPALLPLTDKTILVIEPRRLAARLSAERIADELGETVGQTIGYQMRFEQAVSEKTRIKFITEGLFSRLIHEDPLIHDVGVVIIDEFHERHIQTDIALAITRELIVSGKRKDLKLLVMSATLNLKPLQAYLEAPVFNVEGKTYPVEVEHLGEMSLKPAVEKMLKDGRCNGNILVFMTGLGEILRAKTELQKIKNISVFPLSAEVPRSDQQAIFDTSSQRKIILATNVAETSVTLPDIAGVIDLGKAKVASLATWSGLTSIDIKRVAQSSCIQRAGRAGRTQAGLCYRLFDQADFLSRPAFLAPEIQRLDLSQTLLDIKILQEKLGLAEINFLDHPSDTLLETAHRALTFIEAIDQNGHITLFGKTLAKLPMHPRLAAIIVKGELLRIPDEALVVASIVNEGGIVRPGLRSVDRGNCDLRYQVKLTEELKKGELNTAQERILDKSRLQRVKRLTQTLAKRLGRSQNLKTNIDKVSQDQIAEMLLAGFSDRLAVARPQPRGKKAKNLRAFNLCLGRGGNLAEGSVIEKAPFILAIDASESQDKRSAAFGTEIRIASQVLPKHFEGRHSILKKESNLLVWDEKSQEVKRETTILWGQVQISKGLSDICEQDIEQASRVLLKRMIEIWPEPFEDKESLTAYHNKLKLIHKQNIACHLPILEGDILELMLESLCEGHYSLAEITKNSMAQHIQNQLSYEESEELKSLTPDQIKLPSGRYLKVHYESDKPPWVESRLQDFLGMGQNPKICKGIPVVIHLLAPNRRAVQVTSDLGRFWQGSYKQVRTEMLQRYPKHHWPEDPLNDIIKKR